MRNVNKSTVPAAGYARFWCAEHKKYKGVPHQRYEIGDKVNFTLKGNPAYDLKGSIQSIDTRGVLEVAGPTRYYRCTPENVTPDWAPPPLVYFHHGKCWCDIAPEPEPAGEAVQ